MAFVPITFFTVSGETLANTQTCRDDAPHSRDSLVMLQLTDDEALLLSSADGRKFLVPWYSRTLGNHRCFPRWSSSMR